MSAGWSFWIDRGGTFTDIVARRPDGRFETTKLLSDNPELYEDAASEGVRRLLGTPPGKPIPLHLIDDIRMGTTVATNALLERKGAPTVFVVTKGFADLLRIGRQSRPDLFALDIRKPTPLHGRVVEVDARTSLDGDALTPLDHEAVTAALNDARADGHSACAISLIHAWKHPQMEQAVADLARRAGFETVIPSHEADPLIGYVARSATSVLDAYLTPPLQDYVGRISRALGGANLSFMQSNGGLCEAEQFRAKDAVLSGPAGGVVGAARTAEALGYSKVIGFDMGGTSTDVSVYDSAFQHVVEADIEGMPLRAPMMDIHTVAAGGGSILRLAQRRLQAGPDSAGADPGPSAYGKGGPATVTDANLVLGRIQASAFPAVFGPSGDAPLDVDAARARFAALADEMETETGKRPAYEDVAAGGLRVAVAAMARAIRKVTLERGRDPRDFAMQCFGGAGGQHACRVADALGIRTVIVHPFAGVLSAFGIGLADETDIRRASLEAPLDDDGVAAARARLEALYTEQVGRLGRQGLTTRQSVWSRYAGSDTRFQTELSDPDEMRSACDRLHTARYGFSARSRDLIIESVESEVRRDTPSDVSLPGVHDRFGAPLEHVRMWSGDAVKDAPLYRRSALGAGQVIGGPALISDDTATTVVEAGWTATVREFGDLILTRNEPDDAAEIDAARAADPVTLELFSNMFMAVAERMGAVLRDTAVSVNIRERLDFSCGLFDADGQLLANAPHMPVHLGAMGESVRAVLRSRGDTLKPGDMIALNNPYNGGSHLPDVTVIAPVFDPGGRRLRFFVANRGHHADVGGLTPGSTPPDAKTLEEEGVVIDDLLVADGNGFREEAVRNVLAAAPYPARNPDTNISDLRAQIAANRAGAEDLSDLVARYGWGTVSAYAAHILDNAEESIRRAIARLGDGEMKVLLDDGTPLKVSVRVDHDARTATVDFTGTGPQRPGNFNAPPAVARSAVLYAFRCLLTDPLPLNEGCLRPITIIIPDGTFLSPTPGAAVVAGNTEVSQVACNAIFGALGACAAAQGTMNNLLFGNAEVQYYETICGGAGAGPDFDGASAVHTHMTNTRITDPEILELNYPVRLEQFAIRVGSGGKGKRVGGDGAIRSIRALTDMTATLVSSSRANPPFGLHGGASGHAGTQHVTRANGTIESVTGVTTLTLESGDLLTIETPGGGGWGVSES